MKTGREINQKNVPVRNRRIRAAEKIAGAADAARQRRSFP